ncbi:MAG: hypothetical protein NXI04_21520 [Planctomycetaceae bacterium]|nr:hypothetical protein [Planctomycetaceae bacterium]
MRVYLKPRSTEPSDSLLADCEMLSAFICRTLHASEDLTPADAMRQVQAQTERVFHFDWEQVWLVVEESCEPPADGPPPSDPPSGVYSSADRPDGHDRRVE